MPRDPIFPVRLDPDLKDKLAELAEARGISLAEAMRQGAEQLLTATGKAGLPLGDRDESWDAQAAKDSLSPAQYADAFFYRDPDGDPENVTSYKLGFAKNDNGLHAVWAGITAVAAALQGSRGGVDIPAADQDTIKGKVSAYYRAAAKKYQDDTITPPWDSSAAADEEAFMPDPTTLAPGDTPPSDGGGSGNVPPTADLSDPTVAAISSAASTIVHCPDYGDAYWNPDTGDVWWEACDGDPYPAEPGGGPDSEDVPAGTPFDEIEAIFMAIDGVQSVTIEAENLPPDGYQLVPEEGDGGDVNPPAEEAPAATAAEQVIVLNGLAFPPVEADGFRLVGFDVLEPPSGEQGDSPPDASTVGGGVHFHSVLAIEGKPTDDGRMIEVGALEWRELPLTLMAIIEDSHGGMPQTRTAVAGRIDLITREEQDDGSVKVIGGGVFDTGEVGSEIARLVMDEMMTGVSVDLAVKEAEEVYGEPDEDAPEGAVEDPLMGGSFLLVVKKAVILGATVCPFPAFGEADIEAVAASGNAERLAAWRMPVSRFTETGAIRGLTVIGQFEVVPADPVPPAPGGDSGQGMIAVYPQPDEAAALADPDGNIPPEALHVTLFHFDAMPDTDALSQVVDEFVQGYAGLAGTIGGSGVFGAGEDDDGNPSAPNVLLLDVPGLGELRFDLADALEAAGFPYSEDHDFTPHLTTDYADPADVQLDMTLIGKPVNFNALSIVTADGTRMDVPLSSGITASAAGLVPVHPPGAWFDYPTDIPEVDGDTLIPLTVTDDGRVYGHIAAFNECHIGSQPGQCQIAPHHYRAREDDRPGCAICGEREQIANHSRSGYNFFHLGELETAEGDLVRVGQITLGTTHATTASGMTAKLAQQHYDDTGLSSADGVIYEDNVGPFFAGALRPEQPAHRVREFRAAKPSGDWRGIKGRRELIGVLMVNKPGYPIMRRSTQINDAGEERELALVAAGYPDPARYGTPADCDDVLDEINVLLASARGPSAADVIAGYRIETILRDAR